MVIVFSLTIEASIVCMKIVKNLLKVDINQEGVNTSDRNLVENLDPILIKGLEAVEAESGQIFLYDDQTNTLLEIASTTEKSFQEPRPVRGVFEYVVSSKEAVQIGDLKDWEPQANMNSRLAIRLMADDLVIGIFNAEHSRLNAFNQTHQEIIKALAPQMAMAIQSAYLFEQVARQASLLKAASEVSSNAISIQHPNDLLNKTVNTIVEKFDVYYAAIFLIDEEKKEWAILQAGSGEAGRKMLANGYRLRVGSDTAVGQAAGPLRKPRHFSYDIQDKRRLNSELPDTRSEIALPLFIKAGQRYEILGVLSVHSTEEDAFSGKNIEEILQAMADQLAIAISNARLYLRSEAERELIEVLREIDRRIISLDETKTDILNFILNKGCQLTGAEAGQIFLVEEDNTLKVKIATEKRDLNTKVPMVVGTIIGDAVFRKDMLVPDLADMLSQDKKAGQLHHESVDYSDAYKKEMRSWAAVSIHQEDGNPIGVLSVEHGEPNQFTSKHINILSALAGQAVIAMKNRTLMEQAEVRNRHLEATAQVGADIISILSVEELLNKTVELIHRKFSLYYAGIFLIEEIEKIGHKQRVVKLKAEFPKQLNRDHQFEIGNNSMLGFTINTGKAQIAHVALDGGNGTTRLDITNLLGNLSKISLPLRNRDNIIGALEVQSINTVFTADDTQILQALADQLATAIYNAELYQRNAYLFSQAQRRAGLLRAAAKVSQSVISIFDLDNLLDKIVNTICDEFKDREFHYATVFLVDETGQYAWQRAGSGELGRKMIEQGFKFEIGKEESLVGAVIQSGQGLIELNLRARQEKYYRRSLLSDTQSEMVLPLKIGNRIIGALTVHSQRKDAFTIEDAQTLQSMADQLAIAIDNVQKQEKLLEAETLKTIDEATSQAMHWVANKARPINEYIERIEKEISPIILTYDVDERTQEDFFEAVEVIKQNTRLILDTKQEIMGTAREFELVNIRIKDIIQGVLKQIDIPSKQIELNVASELPQVWVDRVAMEEVFRNLFINAIQAMKNTELPRLQIKAQMAEPNNFVEVRVIDNGGGIPADKIKNIWTPFYTTKAATGGTGVGLSYCLQAMHKMYGKISIESKVGKGTTFILKIPIHRRTETMGTV